VKKPNSVEQLVAAQSELLRDMFIAELVIAGIPQLEIARAVRVDLNRVNRIAKLLKKRKKGNAAYNEQKRDGRD
jgi:hypothetical protein